MIKRSFFFLTNLKKIRIRQFRQKITFIVHKSLLFNLINIWGLEQPFCKKLILKLGVSYKTLITFLTLSHIYVILFFLRKGLTKAKKTFKIMKLFDYFKRIRLIKVFRLLKGLPIRGQRTHGNARTTRLMLQRVYYFLLRNYSQQFVLKKKTTSHKNRKSKNKKK